MTDTNMTFDNDDQFVEKVKGNIQHMVVQVNPLKKWVIVPYNCNNFCMKLVEYNEYLVNTLDTLPPVAPFTNMV